MPTYEYNCPSCGHGFTAEQRITDEPIRTCPRCRKKKVEKLINGGAFILKGSGWAKDGYAASTGTGKAGETKPGEGCASARKDSAGCASCPANNR